MWSLNKVQMGNWTEKRNLRQSMVFILGFLHIHFPEDGKWDMEEWRRRDCTYTNNSKYIFWFKWELLNKIIAETHTEKHDFYFFDEHIECVD